MNLPSWPRDLPVRPGSRLRYALVLYMLVGALVTAMAVEGLPLTSRGDVLKVQATPAPAPAKSAIGFEHATQTAEAMATPNAPAQATATATSLATVTPEPATEEATPVAAAKPELPQPSDVPPRTPAPHATVAKPSAPAPAQMEVVPPLAASVTLTDSGPNPRQLSVGVGGVVTWNNAGSNVHTITRIGAQNGPVDSGGLGRGQSFSFPFTEPGMYQYTSATDCLHGNKNVDFDCAAAVIDVVPVPAAAKTGGSADSTPIAVQISDRGFTPAEVTVRLGSSIMWTNVGTAVHSATAAPGTRDSFDTGGLAHGQAVTTPFVNPGDVLFSSAPDCGNGRKNAGFECSSRYVVHVTA